MRKTAFLEAVQGLNLEFEKREKAVERLEELAKSLSASGCYGEAEEKYKSILAVKKNDASAWSSLAWIYYGVRRYRDALDAIAKALEIDPSMGIHHYRFGLIVAETGYIAEPFQAYQRAMGFASDEIFGSDKIAPIASYFDALRSMESLLRQRVEASPNAFGYLSLGNILMAEGKIDSAIEVYEEAIRLKSNDPIVFNNLGAAFEIKKNQPKATLYFGYASFYQKNYGKALLQFQEFLDAQGGDVRLYVALGECNLQLKRYEETIKTLRQGIERFPASADLYLNLVRALDKAGYTQKAKKVASDALDLAPDHLLLKYARHLALPVLYESQEELDLYRRQFAQGLEFVIGETRLGTLQDKWESLRAISRRTNFYLAYQCCNDLELQRKYGELVTRIMAANYPHWAECRPVPSFGRGGKIRIGYVSAFFRHHSVANLTYGWVRHSNKQDFEIYCYYIGEITDYVTSQFRRHSDIFRHIPEDLEAICRQIYSDQLHILVFPDIGMSPQTTQIAGLRLAPVQCVGWGHPVTSGLPTMDYFLSGDLMEPENAQEHYTEKLIRLPNIGVSYEEPDLPEDRKSRADFGIPPDRIVYLSCQSLFRYLHRYDYLFAEIAQRVPNALFVFLHRFKDRVTQQFRDRLKRAFTQVGLDSEDYCLFLPIQGYVSYLNLHLVSDIYLDTLGWSGGNTTLEAIARGLPVVTFPGEFMRGRHSFAILKMLGVTETIAKDEASYIEIAINLGLDPERRRNISSAIISRHSRLYDDKTCVAALEDFYRQVVLNRL